MADDQFQTMPDPQGGLTLQPAPDLSALSPADLGLPPEFLAALGPMPQLPHPAMAQLPPPTAADPRQRLLLLATIGALLGAGKYATGLGAGLLQSQQQQDITAFQRFKEQQAVQQKEQTLLATQQRAEAVRQQARAQQYVKMLGDTRKALDDAESPEEFDRILEQHAADLASANFRVTPASLHQQFQYSDKKAAQHLVDRMLKNPLTLEAMKADPERFIKGTVPNPSPGRTPIPIPTLFEMAGSPLVSLADGSLITMPGVEKVQDAFKEILQDRRKVAVAKKGGPLTPEEDLALVEQARKDASQAAHITVNPPAGDVDVEAIAEGIIKGEQPPETTGLYRYGAAVRSQLAKKGFNLAKAQEDWRATNRYLSTLNGPQQVRLRQATRFAYDSLDIIDDLAKQWDAGGYPLLNSARLVAARNGALGPQAQALATKLTAQIADLTSELGTVYKGGTSSTDESLKLAAQNLQANWSRKTLAAMTDLLRKNLQIRLNSIQLTGAQANPANPYAPATGQPDVGDLKSILRGR